MTAKLPEPNQLSDEHLLHLISEVRHDVWNYDAQIRNWLVATFSAFGALLLVDSAGLERGCVIYDDVLCVMAATIGVASGAYLVRIWSFLLRAQKLNHFLHELRLKPYPELLAEWDRVWKPDGTWEEFLSYLRQSRWVVFCVPVVPGLLTAQAIYTSGSRGVCS